MNTLDSFLDTMFAPYPTTPRLTKAKSELRAMMEDAYNDAISRGKTHNEAVGQVITDFGNLEDLAPTLGISAELQSDKPSEPTGTNSGYPVVTIAEAHTFAKARRDTAHLLSLAVFVFVCSPIPSTILQSISADGSIGLTSNMATLIGSTFILLMVGLGVVLLVRRSAAFAGVKHLSRGLFIRNPKVVIWAEKQRLAHEPQRIKALMVAIFLWIISAVPIMFGAWTAIDSNQLRNITINIGVAVSLLLVAAGLYIFLRANWAASVHSTFIHMGFSSNSPESKKAYSPEPESFDWIGG